MVEVRRKPLWILALVGTALAALLLAIRAGIPERATPRLLPSPATLHTNGLTATAVPRTNGEKRPLHPVSVGPATTRVARPPAASVNAPGADPRTGADAPPSLVDAPVSERQAYADSLKGQTSAQVLDQLLKALETNDMIRRGVLADALAMRFRFLQNAGSDEAWRRITDMLADAEVSTDVKRVLVEILGRAQAVAPTAYLVEQATALKAGELRDAVLREIARTGDDRWGGRFHEELSPSLEAAWREADGDGNLSSALAVGIAKLGTPAGVSLLLESALDTRDSRRTDAAGISLRDVRNPKAVTALSAHLLDGTREQQTVCGTTLAMMGHVDATTSLLKWAEAADRTQADLAARWFGMARDEASLELIARALDPTRTPPFKSEEVRAAIQAAYQRSLPVEPR